MKRIDKYTILVLNILDIRILSRGSLVLMAVNWLLTGIADSDQGQSQRRK